MQRQLVELTGMIEQTRGRLLQGYRRKQLHVLRVGIRRIRSMLKQIGSHRSRRFRKTWGGFAAVTNEARDWDVFMGTAGKLLPEGQFTEFARLNRDPVASSHEAVVEMLQSAHWERHLDEWRNYLKRAGRSAPGEIPGGVSLDQAVDRARLALAFALSENDDRSWHKFRIAIKDVRYVADSLSPEQTGQEYLAGVIASCKTLQTLLGNWHDTAVQLHMLDELTAAPVHDHLRQVIAREKEGLLSRIHDQLDGAELFPANS